MRGDRKREREREMRLDNLKGEQKRGKLERERERDISEKVALGLHRGGGRLEGEAQYDARLFNQSGGMDAGFGADDDYSAYSKPLFNRGAAESVYRPRNEDGEMTGAGADEEYDKIAKSDKFRPAEGKGFAGADSARGVARDKPVQFEQARPANDDDKDPFDLKEFDK